MAETFVTLNNKGIMLNLEKCTFGISYGKLLGFLINSRGIEVNTKKIRAIESLRPPSTTKEVQGLTGRMTTLSHFISRSGERGFPFFKVIENMTNFNGRIKLTKL